MTHFRNLYKKTMLCLCVLTIGINTKAQIITSLDHPFKRGVITSLEKDTPQSEDTTLLWKETLQDLEKKGSVTVPMKQIESETDSITYKRLIIGNKTFDIPSYINQDGIDMFMLTESGITIHMAALEPIYLQQTSPALIKWIRYYAYTNRRYTEKILKRYSKWQPYIDACFTSHQVPIEISILCLVESGCTYEAKSSAGAVGMWQIMPQTAREWGMSVNEHVDERTDPVISSTTAAKILIDNYRRCEDWTLAIAGYNCGMGRISQSINKAGINKWDETVKFLPKETQEYIPSLLAIYYVWCYKNELGFNI